MFVLFILLMNFCEVCYIEDKLTLIYKDLQITLEWSSPDIYKIELDDNYVINLEHILNNKV